MANEAFLDDFKKMNGLVKLGLSTINWKAAQTTFSPLKLFATFDDSRISGHAVTSQMVFAMEVNYLRTASVDCQMPPVDANP